MDKNSSLIKLTLVTLIFISTFFNPVFSFTENIPYSKTTINSYHIQQLNNDDSLEGYLSYPENDNKDIVEEEIDPSIILQKMSEFISNMEVTHITADTIKRILLAHLNSASLILNDNDSDNDPLICSNIIPKFISDITLYEEISILKADQANKVYQQIDVLENLYCNLN